MLTFLFSLAAAIPGVTCSGSPLCEPVSTDASTRSEWCYFGSGFRKRLARPGDTFYILSCFRFVWYSGSDSGGRVCFLVVNSLRHESARRSSIDAQFACSNEQ